MNIHKLYRQRGQSTVELMVAIFVFTIAMAGIAAVIFGNQFLSLDGEMNNIGVAKAQDLLEQQRANGKNNFYGVVAGVTTDGPYTKTVTVNDLNQCQKEVTAKIAWSTGQGAPKQITLTTLINNLAEQLAQGGECSGVGNANPATTCPVLVESKANPTDTFQVIGSSNATGIKVQNGVVYISSIPFQAGAKDFWIMNVDSNYLFSVDSAKSINTGSGGLNALDIAGNYVYAASVNGSAQLQIISLQTNPPSVVGTLSLPGNTSPAISIAYRSNKVFIGTEASAGPEFFVVDVSNPTFPVKIGELKVGGSVNKINLIGSAAYLATTNSSKQTVEVDINTMSQTNVFNPSGSVGAQSLYFLGSKMFVGSALGSTSNFHMFNLVNFSSLGSINLSNLNFESNNLGQINEIIATGNMAYVGTGVGGSPNRSRFSVLNVTDPSNIFSCNVTQTLSTAPVVGMDFKNGLVYIAVKSNSPLKIIKLSY